MPLLLSEALNLLEARLKSLDEKSSPPAEAVCRYLSDEEPAPIGSAVLAADHASLRVDPDGAWRICWGWGDHQTDSYGRSYCSLLSELSDDEIEEDDFDEEEDEESEGDDCSPAAGDVSGSMIINGHRYVPITDGPADEFCRALKHVLKTMSPGVVHRKGLFERRPAQVVVWAGGYSAVYGVDGACMKIFYTHSELIAWVWLENERSVSASRATGSRLKKKVKKKAPAKKVAPGRQSEADNSLVDPHPPKRFNINGVDYVLVE